MKNLLLLEVGSERTRTETLYVKRPSYCGVTEYMSESSEKYSGGGTRSSDKVRTSMPNSDDGSGTKAELACSLLKITKSFVPIAAKSLCEASIDKSLASGFRGDNRLAKFFFPKRLETSSPSFPSRFPPPPPPTGNDRLNNFTHSLTLPPCSSIMLCKRSNFLSNIWLSLSMAPSRRPLEPLGIIESVFCTDTAFLSAPISTARSRASRPSCPTLRSCNSFLIGSTIFSMLASNSFISCFEAFSHHAGGSKPCAGYMSERGLLWRGVRENSLSAGAADKLEAKLVNFLEVLGLSLTFVCSPAGLYTTLGDAMGDAVSSDIAEDFSTSPLAVFGASPLSADS
mmetsp:Transcript_129657/g.250056  ORF Transcript_129657/g.250056 Transcript_129657/m.250056 type:complete len:341 (+) Transcript_129657:221-1243(+)